MSSAATKDTLKHWLVEALEESNNRAAHHVDVAKYIWANHQAELEASGDLFFTWQYDLRWAATNSAERGACS
jgi:hypothetical protein